MLGGVSPTSKVDTPIVASEGLLEIGEGVQGVVAEFSAAISEADLPAVGAEAQKALQEATATLVRVRRTVEGSRYDIEVALENLRVTTENLRDLTATLKSQPSLLIRGQAAPPRKPGTEP